MRNLGRGRHLVLVMATLLPWSPLASQESAMPAEAQQVRDAFTQINRAISASDLAALSELVHPHFAMLHARGQIESRAAWFKLIEAGRIARQTAERREFEPEIIVQNDTALLRSLVRMRQPDEDQWIWLRSTSVFVREGGRWRQINQQSSFLHEGPDATPADLDVFVGSYAIPNREVFAVERRDGYLEVVWASGARLPLVPTGGDSFLAGLGSTVRFTRNAAGGVIGAERTGQDGRRWWLAEAR